MRSCIITKREFLKKIGVGSAAMASGMVLGYARTQRREACAWWYRRNPNP